MVADKDAQSGTAHELHDLSTHNTYDTPETPDAYDTPQLAAPQYPERRRVRINSSAAEIPGRPRVSTHSHIEDIDETITEPDAHTAEADDLLRAHRQEDAALEHLVHDAMEATEDDAYGYSGNTQGGVFYQLLQAYKTPVPAYPAASSEASLTPPAKPEPSSRPNSSGWQTPRKKKWYAEKEGRSQETLATLVGAAAELANPRKEASPQVRRHHKRNSSNPILSMIWKVKEEQDAKIKVHVASLLKRQQYIIKMCRALMLFGAPTHRLEEYLAMTAKVLEINSQFLYIPGCMIISFDDVLTVSNPALYAPALRHLLIVAPAHGRG
jgi:hypothetical protein